MLWIEKRRVFSLFIMLLLGAEIFYISSISGSTAGTGFPLIPVIYHFSVFFLFSFFLFFSIKGEKEIKFGHAISALLISLIYAISDEFHQSFVPLRNSSSGDVLTDLAGISFSMLISIFISKISIQSH